MNAALDNALKTMESSVADSIDALIERGSSISTDSGIVHLPKAIRELPTSDTSISFYQDDTEAYKKAIPRGAQTYSNLISVGGKTRKVPGVNLFTNASKDGIKWSIGVNQQEQYFSDLLEAGSYRLYLDAESELEDDVVSWGYGAVLNDSGLSFKGAFINSGEFFTITEPKYIVPWVGAIESGTPASITVTQSGGNDDTPIVLGQTKYINIGEANADGTPTFCTISINTNTRVKVTVSQQFENQSDKEFIVGKGEHSFYWANTNPDDDLVGISLTVEQYSFADIAVTLYPMLYKVPDNSSEHILNKYEPYFENLVPTAVTEIVSKGANLAVSTDDTTGSNRGITVTRQNGKSFAVVDGTATADASVKLFGTFKLNAGTYTASVYGLNDADYIYIILDGSALKDSQFTVGSPKKFTITEEKECLLQMVCKSGSAYSNTKIEVMLNVGATAAPYRPYWSETVAIPDDVKDDASWGNSYNDDVNTYNFTEKAYTKAVNFIELDGVTAGKKFSGSDMMGNVRRMTISSLPKIRNSSTANESVDFDITYFTPKAVYSVGKAHFYANPNATSDIFICCIPPEYYTVTKGNAWLAEMKANGTPIRLVYPLAEPTITTIGSDTKPFLFKTEAEGEIVFENTDKEAVPSSVKYLIDIGEAQL